MTRVIFPYEVSPLATEALEAFLGPTQFVVASIEEAYQEAKAKRAVVGLTDSRFVLGAARRRYENLHLQVLTRLSPASLLGVTQHRRPFPTIRFLTDPKGKYSKDAHPFYPYRKDFRILAEHPTPVGALRVVGHRSWFKEERPKGDLERIYQENWRLTRPARHLKPLAPIPPSHIPLLALGGFFPRMRVSLPDGEAEVATYARQVLLHTPPATDFLETSEGVVSVTTTTERWGYALDLGVRYEDGREVYL